MRHFTTAKFLSAVFASAVMIAITGGFGYEHHPVTLSVEVSDVATIAPIPITGDCSDEVPACGTGATKHEMESGETYMYSEHGCMTPPAHSGPACQSCETEVCTGSIDTELLEELDYDAVITNFAVVLKDPVPLAHITWNAERQAVQILDCDGLEIAYHIPVSDEHLGLFSD